MIHAWNLLWDWNTLTSVRTVHSWFEGIALIFFALLVVFEVLEHLLEKKFLARIALLCFGIAVIAEIVAYPYGQKNDELAQREIAVLNHSTQQLETEYAQAQLEIADANERAKDAEAEVATAKADSDKASAKAESFRFDIAKSNEAAGEAEAKAAEANLELAKMKTPRSLSSDAEARVVAAIKPFAGTPYDLCVGDDAESLAFMRTIQAVLNTAGWRQVAAKSDIGISGSDPMIGVLTLNAGVYIEIASEKASQWRPSLQALAKQLYGEGIAAGGNIAETGADPDAVHVYVGKKP